MANFRALTFQGKATQIGDADSLIVGAGLTTGAGALALGSASGVVSLTGDLEISGDLTVDGTTITADSETVLIADNHLYLNNGYAADTPQTGGLVVNYDPTTTVDTVAGAYVAGVASTSNPTVTTTGSATFSAGDLIQIDGANDNNGLFEVLSHSGTTLTIRGVGTTGTVEDFTQNQFVAGASDGAGITLVNVSILRAGTDGAWETGAGSTTPISFTDLATGGGNTLQQAYVAGNTITTSGANGDFTVTGDQDFVIGNAVDLDWQSTGNLLIPDNDSTSFVITQGGNDQLSISTSDGLEAIALGNATTNPDFSFLGSGSVSMPSGGSSYPDSAAASFGDSSDFSIQHNGTSNLIASVNGGIFLDAPGSTEIVLNQNGADVDTRIEGDTATHMLAIDASQDRILITDVASPTLNAALPAAMLHVHTETASINGGILSSYSGADASGGSGRMVMVRTLGTTASPTPIQTGDLIGELVFSGQFFASPGSANDGAIISAEAVENFAGSDANTPTNTGTELSFWTTPAGAGDSVRHMALGDDGDLYPVIDNAADLGRVANAWKDLFMTGAVSMEQSTAPTNVANTGFVFVEDDSGDAELRYLDDTGRETQLTRDGFVPYVGFEQGLEGTAVVAGNLVAGGQGSMGGAGVALASHSTDTVRADAVGLALESQSTQTLPVRVAMNGVHTIPDALWDSAPAAADAGKPVYASVTTDGEYTLTAPSTAGQVAQQVGVIVFADASADTTRVAINIHAPVAL